ncbi:MAG: alpha/beta fold hydrolase [Fulvivirga sp.]|nr:alpha/beta fold hydrolase [Fulvivirga sp.]
MLKESITTEEVKIDIDVKPGVISGIFYIPKQMKALLVLAHGAGAGMTHPFMEGLAAHLAEHGIGTLRFNLPYMEAGKKAPGSPKDAMKGIEKAIATARDHYAETPIFVGGKSYGGRIASHLLAEETPKHVYGLIFYGFPLHAPGKSSTSRADHLKNVQVPLLFLQGKKDKLADYTLIEKVVSGLDQSDLIAFEHADHSFKRPKKVSKQSLIPMLAEKTHDWIKKI